MYKSSFMLSLLLILLATSYCSNERTVAEPPPVSEEPFAVDAYYAVQAFRSETNCTAYYPIRDFRTHIVIDDAYIEFKNLSGIFIQESKTGTIIYEGAWKDDLYGICSKRIAWIATIEFVNRQLFSGTMLYYEYYKTLVWTNPCTKANCTYEYWLYGKLEE